MKAYFNIDNYDNYKNIEIIPEINFTDLMDGTPDNMSFSFIYPTDIVPNINLKDLCEVVLCDDNYNLSLTDDLSTHTYYTLLVGEINDTTNRTFYINVLNDDDTRTYTEFSYDTDGNVTYNNTIVGAISIDSNGDGRLIVNKDLTASSDETSIINKIEYIIDNYGIKEDYLKHYHMCLSQINAEKMSTNDNEENGYFHTVLLKEQTILLKDCVRTDLAITPSLYPVEIFPTLYEATLKVVDCHNMCILNKMIEVIDVDLVDALKQVACPNLTYRDLSTYSQLYDIFMRVGRIPYFENGVLYGLILQGTHKDTTYDLSAYSQHSTIKEEGVNDNIYSSKVRDILYDDEYAVVPSIFSDILREYDIRKSLGQEVPYLTNTAQIHTISSTAMYNILHDSASTEKIVVDRIYNSGTDTYSNDTEEIKRQLDNYYGKWTRLTSQSNTDISKFLLFPQEFNNKARDIEDVRNLKLNLPYNIENIKDIYWCIPAWYSSNLIDETEVYAGFQLVKLDMNRMVEQSTYSNLSSLQKRKIAYYTRGGNTIYNIIAMLVSDNMAGIDATTGDLMGNWTWSDGKLYNQLRKAFFVVRYKPIVNSTYTNYNYSDEFDEHKPLAVNNFNLPYSQTTDQQVFPIMEYSLQKGIDTNINVKFFTDDKSILNLTASDIVKYNDKEYIINKVNFLINNRSIECLFELTTNIITNSIISKYRDSVRVSSNINANSAVSRQVHIFGENVVQLLDETDTDADIIDSSSDLFINKIGNSMRNIALYNLGILLAIPAKEYSAANVLSKYPLKLSQILSYNDENNNIGYVGEDYLYLNGVKYTHSSGTIYSYGTSVGTISITDGNGTITLNSETYTVTDFNIKDANDIYTVIVNNDRNTAYSTSSEYDAYSSNTFDVNNDFPLQKIERVFVPNGGSETSEVSYTNVSITELDGLINSGEITCYAILQGGWFGNLLNALNASAGLYGYVYYKFTTANGVVKTIRPPLVADGEALKPKNVSRYWNIAYVENLNAKFGTLSISLPNGKFTPAAGGYSGIYNLNNGYKYYATEKIVSNSGLISRLQYGFVDSSYSSTRYSALITYPSTFDGFGYSTDANIQNTSPVYFNSTRYGCKLMGIGNRNLNSGENEEMYSFKSLPHISDYGYYVDIRETPDSYIQYKTMIKNKSEVIDLIELNNLIKWLSAENVRIRPANYSIVKVPKYYYWQSKNISSSDIEIVAYADLSRDLWNNRSAKFDLYTDNTESEVKTLTHLDDEVYLLVLNATEDNGVVTMQLPLLSFNVKEGKQTKSLRFKSEIFNNY